MLSLEEIDKSILELESRDTTFATCERLAWLYVVRDHITGNTLTRSATPNYSSEFLAAASTCELDLLLEILNDHFETIKAIFPKEYYAVLNKIKNNE